MSVFDHIVGLVLKGLSFNYCPLVWHFSPNKSIKKLKIYRSVVLDKLSVIRKGKSDYKTLLDKCGKESAGIRRIKTLAIEYLKLLLS